VLYVSNSNMSASGRRGRGEMVKQRGADTVAHGQKVTARRTTEHACQDLQRLTARCAGAGTERGRCAGGADVRGGAEAVLFRGFRPFTSHMLHAAGAGAERG